MTDPTRMVAESGEAMTGWTPERLDALPECTGIKLTHVGGLRSMACRRAFDGGDWILDDGASLRTTRGRTAAGGALRPDHSDGPVTGPTPDDIRQAALDMAAEWEDNE